MFIIVLIVVILICNKYINSYMEHFDTSTTFGNIPSTTMDSGSMPSTTMGGGSMPSTTMGGGSMPSTTMDGGSMPSTTIGTGRSSTTIENTIPNEIINEIQYTIPLTTYGYKILDTNPQTNLYQHNFDGTSNVYAPYIYHNMEAFSPINLYNDKLSPY